MKINNKKCYWTTLHKKPNCFKNVKDKILTYSQHSMIINNRKNIETIYIEYKIDKYKNIDINNFIEFFKLNYGIELSESNLYIEYFSKDGGTFPFIDNITIYDIEKYNNFKLLKERKNKIFKLKNKNAKYN